MGERELQLSGLDRLWIWAMLLMTITAGSFCGMVAFYEYVRHRAVSDMESTVEEILDASRDMYSEE